MKEKQKKGTRFEKRREELIQNAKTAKFFAFLELFPNEAKRLEKEGLKLFPMSRSSLNQKVEYYISWSGAFNDSDFLSCYVSYICNFIDCMPLTKNLAEELYLISTMESLQLKL